MSTMDSAGGSSPQVEDSQKWHENGSSIGLDRPLDMSSRFSVLVHRIESIAATKPLSQRKKRYPLMPCSN